MKTTVAIHTDTVIDVRRFKRVSCSIMPTESIDFDHVERCSAGVLIVGSDVKDRYAVFTRAYPCFKHVIDLHRDANPAYWRKLWLDFWHNRSEDVASSFRVECPYTSIHAENSNDSTPDLRKRISRALSSLVKKPARRRR